VAEVDVGSGGVDAEIDAKWCVCLERVFELRFQFGFGNDFGRTFFEVGELFFDGFEFGFGHFSVRLNYAAAFDFVMAFEDDSNGFGINPVFFLQDAHGQRVFRVVVVYWQDGLENDGAGVEIFVNEMDRAAGELDAVLESLALRLETWKRGQQRWVNVQNAVWKRGHKIRRQQAHVAGEADEIDFVLVQDRYNLAIIGFAL